MNVIYQMEYKQFMQNLEKLFDNVIKANRQKLVQWTQIFTKQAVRYTPPNIGRTNIAKTFYTRPILNLIELARGKYANYRFTSQDAQALRGKMKFKIINTKKGVKPNTAYAYAKKIGDAKRFAKIQTRGNLRYQWAKNISSISGSIPASLLALERKATKLKDMDYNKIYFSQDKMTVFIENKAEFANEGVLSIAIRRGLKAVNTAIKRYQKQINNQIQSFNKKN